MKKKLKRSHQYGFTNEPAKLTEKERALVNRVGEIVDIDPESVSTQMVKQGGKWVQGTEVNIT